MGAFIDLLGARFGRLTVIGQDQTKSDAQAMWICKCDCGNTKVIRSRDLRNGTTRSCGCLQKELARERASTLKGRHLEKLHGVWNTMKQRCNNPRSKDFKYYGARGVSVCELWREDYLAFREWALSNGYAEGLTIDRINVDGDYTPDNCRWITIQEQQKNRRIRS